ncbi:MAG: hypothetical protein R2939_11635 [Kofleriaceae bacterium]
MATNKPAGSTASTTGWRPPTMSRASPSSISRPHVAAPHRDLGQALGGVDGRQPPADRGDDVGVGGDPGHQRAHQLALAGGQGVLGGQHPALELGQLRGDEALAGGHRLLAHEVRRHPRELALADLDVVAEDPVVADLEAGDARGLPLARLDGEDLLLAAVGQAPALIDLLIEARADDAAVLGQRRRIVDERGRQLGGEGGQGRRRQAVGGEQWRRLRPQPRGQGRQRQQRVAQPAEVARRGHRQGRLASEALEVGDAVEGRAQRPAPVAVIVQIGHRVLAAMDGRHLGQRIEDPAAQAAGAGGGAGVVDDVEQRAAALAADEGLDQLEVGDGGLVEDDRVAGLVGHQLAHRHRAHRLGRLGIADDLGRDSPGQRRRLADAGDAGQAGAGAGVVAGGHRGPGRAAAAAQGRQRAARADVDGGGEDLARRHPRQLVAERAHGGHLGHPELAGGDVEVRQRQRAAITAGGREVVRRARLEGIVIEDHAGRHHPHDLAPDQALGRARVLGLLADDDLVPGRGELGDVAARRVVRHPAHRHRIGLALVAGGEREAEQARGEHRVLEEHLVEVAEPEEHDRLGVAILDLQELPHQRRFGRLGPGHEGPGVPGRSDVAAPPYRRVTYAIFLTFCSKLSLAATASS